MEVESVLFLALQHASYEANRCILRSAWKSKKVGFFSPSQSKKQNVKGVGAIEHTGFAPCFHTAANNRWRIVFPCFAILMYEIIILCWRNRRQLQAQFSLCKPLCPLALRELVHEGLLHCHMIWAVNEEAYNRTIRQWGACLAYGFLPIHKLLWKVSVEQLPRILLRSHGPDPFHTVFLCRRQRNALRYAANSPLSFEKALFRLLIVPNLQRHLILYHPFALFLLFLRWAMPHGQLSLSLYNILFRL